MNVQKHKTHVQGDCFCSLNLKFCDVLVAVAVVVAKTPYWYVKSRSGLAGDAKITAGSKHRENGNSLTPLLSDDHKKKSDDLFLCGNVPDKNCIYSQPHLFTRLKIFHHIFPLRICPPLIFQS